MSERLTMDAKLTDARLDELIILAEPASHAVRQAHDVYSALVGLRERREAERCKRCGGSGTFVHCPPDENDPASAGECPACGGTGKSPEAQAIAETVARKSQAEAAACIEFLETELGWLNFRSEGFLGEETARQSTQNAHKLREFLKIKGDRAVGLLAEMATLRAELAAANERADSLQAQLNAKDVIACRAAEFIQGLGYNDHVLLTRENGMRLRDEARATIKKHTAQVDNLSAEVERLQRSLMDISHTAGERKYSEAALRAKIITIAMAALSPAEQPQTAEVRFGHAGILCPPHVKTAAQLADFPQVYGCPQCAVNHVAELEELITEMYSHLPGAARLRFNDSEAGRIFERANMAALQPAIEALKSLAAEQPEGKQK